MTGIQILTYFLLFFVGIVLLILVILLSLLSILGPIVYIYYDNITAFFKGLTKDETNI